MTTNVETYQFQAETKHLLDLMIHSLYTAKEIFLRELISNAQDALDRLRFESLTRPELAGEGEKLEIRIEVDRAARTLTVRDTGIGMSREEVIANIGTIAKSGTRELREEMKKGGSSEILSQLIGQFGVGFYSSFMVADKVTLVTRRAGETGATRWESDGEGQYSITEAEKAGHGTDITLHLKPVDHEGGIEDYTDRWILARVVRKYSDFISYPIIFKDEREEVERDELGAPKEGAPKTIVVEDKILNTMKPIWMRPQAEVTEEEYAESYKHLTHDTEAPLQSLYVKAEGRLEYRALLFIPSAAPTDLFYHGAEYGLRLYAKGVSVMERCAALLPQYLRFVRGLVDSADLPLNISRQTLQQDQQITLIRKWLTKKILDALQQMFDKEREKYLRFWKEFGRAFKEGISSDYENKERIVALSLFESSNHAEELTTLKDYVGRMKEGQEEIFYLTGETRTVVENSPHLEAFKEKGYEVLYLTDPVDELVAQSLYEFEGKRLKSVIKGRVQLGSEEERKREEETLKEKTEQTSELLAHLQKCLDEYVKEVRLTNRLTTSPVCLVGTEIDYSPQLERLLQAGKGGPPRQRRILEINPGHEVFAKLQAQFEREPGSPLITDYAELLLGYALLTEGSELPDPARFGRLVADLMTRSL